MKSILNKLFNYETLSASEAGELFRGIAQGKYNDAQIASLITVYLMRNITLEELSGFRSALLEFSLPMDFGTRDYIDIVGTGGDGKDTFNISSCSSIVVAAAGYKVVKHGNYGASSISGASNVMEQHGVKFSNNPDVLKKSFDECNFAYLHAPMFNSAMKAVAVVRKNLGVRSFFNMLGPLINPAKPNNQLLGVYNLAMQRMYCYMLQHDRTNFAVVHSLDGYDEISLTSQFKVCTSEGEKLYNPEDLGFARAEQSDLFSGETVEQAAEIFDSVLGGTATQPQRDCVVVNAAYAINVMESTKSIEECIAIAREAIDSGRAVETLKRFVEINS
ncbi:MAG: anthranilate phosphoribosyltransferase [Rikenellaceae bacterium]